MNLILVIWIELFSLGVKVATRVVFTANPEAWT